jgi:hypothetical protein
MPTVLRTDSQGRHGRDILLPKYAEKKITLARIADLAELPTRYAAIVMSDGWAEIHAAILGEKR